MSDKPFLTHKGRPVRVVGKVKVAFDDPDGGFDVVYPNETKIDPELGFDTYQRRANRTAIYPRMQHGWTYPVLGLVNEAGEVAGKLKKVIRDHDGDIHVDDMAALKGELGDVLWYLSQLAKELGLSLEDIAEHNLEKLSSRQARGTLQGEGDNR